MSAGRGSAFVSVFSLMFAGSGQALAQQIKAPAAAVKSAVQATATIAAVPARIIPQAAQSLITAATPSVGIMPPVQAAPVAKLAVPAVSLAALVASKGAALTLDDEARCLATAVYFESMGEPLEGQLAVANVVINRARSGRYPSSWCGVVKQRAQFSFVRNGRFPRIDTGGEAWRKARAIAQIAADNLASALPHDVLWYHADYVAPSWGKRLNRVEKIGAHIFYRA